MMTSKLISQNDKIVIAISGGPDSVALYYILKELKYKFNLKLYFVHINHKLRGNNADEDEKFIKMLAKKENIDLFIKQENIKGYAKREGLSIEEAGREVRYSYFEEIKNKVNADKVALAHNLDDNVETFMFRLMRGTSLHGLKGIPEKRDFYIRPLLRIYKKEILDYLKTENISYVIDSSNMETVYTRNKIRHELIPVIERDFNVNFKEKIVRLIDEIKDSEKYIDQCLGNKNNKTLYLSEIQGKSDYVKKKMLKKFLEKNKVEYNANKIEKIICIIGLGGFKKMDMGNSRVLKKDYEKVYIELKLEPNGIQNKSEILEINEKVFYNNYKIGFRILDNEEKIEKNYKYKIYIDYDKLINKTNLIVRNRKNGDIFYPLGMKGKKKLKDYFIDEKVVKENRDSIPIILDNENIVWIVGMRSSEKYKVDKSTKKIVLLYAEEES